MEKHRIVITGVGVVAPNGIGKDEFWANCRGNVSGIKRITLFDTSRYSSHFAGEIADLQFSIILGPKGIRNLDRTTLLTLVAAKFAIEDADLIITNANSGTIGVVLGSTMGSANSISSFDIELLREGPRYVNPARFPNTVINSPASQVSIRFGIKGLSATVATGFTASIDAIEYAIDMLRLGRLSTVLVGGSEELCAASFSGFDALMSRKGLEPIIGEGSAMFVLETNETAIARGAKIYGEIIDVASNFDHTAMAHCETSEESIRKLLTAGSNRRYEDIKWLSYWEGMSGPRDQSKILETILGVLGKSVSDLPVLSVRKLLGECFSAAGALQLAALIGWDQFASSTGLAIHLGPLGISSRCIVRLTNSRGVLDQVIAQSAAAARNAQN